jgi:GDP-L-fucose synthase
VLGEDLGGHGDLAEVVDRGGEAHAAGARKIIFLGSSCIYPREAPQPLREEYLLTGPLEETNRAYAVAKIAGIELCRSLNREYDVDCLSLMPTNLYGPGDNFDLRTSHVLPALIRKFHEAKRAGDAPDKPVTVWGTGAPLREFLYVDDVGKAVVFCLEHVHAVDVPAGMLNVMDVSRLRGLGWAPTVGLEDGIGRAYEWFVKERA